MSKALNNIKVNPVETHQRTKAKSNQVKNNSGGFVFEVTPQSRLERFLILGVDGGTFNVSEPELTEQNVEFVKQLLETDSEMVINTVVDVSAEGRAKSNSPALFILALAMNTDGVNRKMVSDAVQKVACTSTHLIEYAQYLKNLGGWGRAKRSSIARWYESKRPVDLAYQAVKYRQRNGWTHSDLLRLSHPKLGTEFHGTVEFIHGREWNVGNTPSIIHGFEIAQNASSIDDVVSAVNEYNLPWEAVPTSFHKDVRLWRSLFEADSLGQTALLRNVVRLAKLGAFDDLKFAYDYAQRLADSERIIKGKIHPIQFLNAAVVYEDGQINRNYDSFYSHISRTKSWETNGKIKAALNEGFYLAFKNVEPANKRTMVAVDVSGSMSWSAAAGADLSAAQVAGAMALMIAKTEPYSMVRGFSHVFTDLKVSENDTLDSAMKKVQRSNFGSTDCSLPMQWALENKVEIDTFVVITDNETYFGDIHPFQALKQYRKATGIDARLAVMAVTASSFSIADPSDRGMVDFVGFDASAPKFLADFSAGRI